MRKNEFQCDMCKNIYTKARTDKEALAESKAIWGEIPEEDLGIICGNCFNKKTPAEIKAMGDEHKAL